MNNQLFPTMHYESKPFPYSLPSNSKKPSLKPAEVWLQQAEFSKYKNNFEERKWESLKALSSSEEPLFMCSGM